MFPYTQMQIKNGEVTYIGYVSGDDGSIVYRSWPVADKAEARKLAKAYIDNERFKAEK